MPYEVSFDESDGIVSVRVSGTASKDDHFAAREKAFRLCKKHGCMKVVVDLRELNTEGLSTAGCFSFGEAVAEALPSVRLAHVMPALARARADVRFTSTVESNRGSATREFDTLGEARAWLLGQ